VLKINTPAKTGDNRAEAAKLFGIGERTLKNTIQLKSTSNPALYRPCEMPMINHMKNPY
jgi:hypothetical protein